MKGTILRKKQVFYHDLQLCSRCERIVLTISVIFAASLYIDSETLFYKVRLKMIRLISRNFVC